MALPFLMPLLTAGLTAGASLIGGSMRDRAAREQGDRQYENDRAAAAEQRAWNIEDRDEARVYSRQALAHLVTDAEAAGFNPLTVLRAGGGANYNAAASFAPLSRAAPVRQAPYQGATGEGVAQAGNSFSNFLAGFDPFADDKRELEYGLMQAQIGNLNASTGALRSQSFNVPVRTAGTRQRGTAGTAGLLSKGPPPEAGDRTVTNPWRDHEVHPGYLDAETAEARYGDSEIFQTLYGVRNAAVDLYWNLDRWTRHGEPLVKRTKLPDAQKSWWPTFKLQWK